MARPSIARSTTYDSGTSFLSTHTISAFDCSGTDTTLFVVVHQRNPITEVTSVTANGNAMTLEGSSVNTNVSGVQIYSYKINNASVNIVISTPTFKLCAASVICMENTDQTDAVFQVWTPASGFGTTATSSLTANSADNLILSGLNYKEDRTLTVSNLTGQTDFAPTSTNLGQAASGYANATGSSQTLGWTASAGDNWNLMHAEIVATSAGAVLDIPLINTTSNLYSPTLEPQSVEITIPLIASTTILYTPHVQPAATNLSLSFIPSTNTLYAPELSPQGVQIDIPFIASTSETYTPLITAGDVVLEVPITGSTNVLFTPTLTAGEVLLEIPFIQSVSELFTSTLTVSDVFIEMPSIQSTSQLYPPLIVPDGSLSMAFIESTSELYSPSLETQAVMVELPLINNVSDLFNPIITQNNPVLNIPFMPSISQLYMPTIEREPPTPSQQVDAYVFRDLDPNVIIYKGRIYHLKR